MLCFLLFHDFGRRLTTLQAQYIENLKQILPEMELRNLSPNSYIHVSVSDSYIFP
jgi:hypothetical protein